MCFAVDALSCCSFFCCTSFFWRTSKLPHPWHAGKTRKSAADMTCCIISSQVQLEPNWKLAVQRQACLPYESGACTSRKKTLKWLWARSWKRRVFPPFLLTLAPGSMAHLFIPAALWMMHSKQSASWLRVVLWLLEEHDYYMRSWNIHSPASSQCFVFALSWRCLCFVSALSLLCLMLLSCMLHSAGLGPEYVHQEALQVVHPVRSSVYYKFMCLCSLVGCRLHCHFPPTECAHAFDWHLLNRDDKLSVFTKHLLQRGDVFVGVRQESEGGKSRNTKGKIRYGYIAIHASGRRLSGNL